MVNTPDKWFCPTSKLTRPFKKKLLIGKVPVRELKFKSNEVKDPHPPAARAYDGIVPFKLLPLKSILVIVVIRVILSGIVPFNA